MKWSLKLGKLLGIDVYLHFTFLLLLAFLGFYYWRTTQNVEAALRGVAFIVALFGCVVLHELGHALMARRYGIQTRDITLLPIGGIARLEKMPEKPMQEFWVALAGPAVNVVIAAVLFVGLAATGGFTPVEELGVTGGSFWQRLMVLNLILVAFNLLPAFPMDGGRVLRALLAMRLGRRRATAIAANVGQGMAILFGIVGFFYNPFLIFIAIFVYLGAQAEAGIVEMQSALAGLRVRDAMMTRFRTLAAQDTLGKAVEELLAGSQQDFPVVENDQPIGILRRNDLVKALSEGRRDDAVTAGMSRDCETVDEASSLQSAVESMRAAAVRHDAGCGGRADGRSADARKHQRDDHGQCRDGPPRRGPFTATKTEHPKSMKDNVYKLSELTGTSTKSIEEAVNNALKRAGKTIQNLSECLKNPERGCVVLDQPQQVPHVRRSMSLPRSLRLVFDTAALLFQTALQAGSRLLKSAQVGAGLPGEGSTARRDLRLMWTPSTGSDSMNRVIKFNRRVPSTTKHRLGLRWLLLPSCSRRSRCLQRICCAFCR